MGGPEPEFEKARRWWIRQRRDPFAHKQPPELVLAGLAVGSAALPQFGFLPGKFVIIIEQCFRGRNGGGQLVSTPTLATIQAAGKLQSPARLRQKDYCGPSGKAQRRPEENRRNLVGAAESGGKSRLRAQREPEAEGRGIMVPRPAAMRRAAQPPLPALKVVASLGIEPRTQGFSVLCSTN